MNVLVDTRGDASASGALFQVKNGLVSTLYLFSGLGDGRAPAGQPLVSATGSIFGTTETGGIVTDCAVGCGVIYEYRP